MMWFVVKSGVINLERSKERERGGDFEKVNACVRANSCVSVSEEDISAHVLNMDNKLSFYGVWEVRIPTHFSKLKFEN